LIPRILRIEGEHVGNRVDRVLADQYPDLSRSRIQDLIDNASITLVGRPIKASYRVREGDVLEVTLPPPEPLEAAPEEIPLDICYEDSDLLVINKPQGMVTHPAPGASHGTLVNALLAHCHDLSGIGGVQRPGIVHRLDKDTSGLIVVAKNDVAHLSLQAQISEKSALRQYLAVVRGHLPSEEGFVDAPIGRHPSDRIKMAIVEGGRHALTRYKALEEFSGYSFVELTLDTGRTHQIRVHLASIGHPVVGDPVYGGKTNLPVKLCGQALHAFHLRFVHPRTQETLEFWTDPPQEFQKLLRYLRNQ
jgi:23S rRNA pseudouridine1911/1915/1917 synthase